MTLLYHITWIMAISLSVLGIICLGTLIKFSSSAWKLLPERTKEKLKLFVSLFKSEIKELLFSWGLVYLESKDTKKIYFYSSILAVIFSFYSLLADKTPLALCLLIVSSFLLFLNIIFYNVGKHVLKGFKN
jgi:hypothetical protein